MKKYLGFINKYLFDDRTEILQEQLSDLEWKPIAKKSPHRGDKKEYLVAWGDGLGKHGQISICTANEIHSFNHQALFALDHGTFYEYAEIPNKEYFFNKFYKDEYGSIKDATTSLLKKYTAEKVEQEARARAYNKKWDIIDHASFFAISNLPHPVKMGISLIDIPFIFEDKEVGKGVLVEYGGPKIHLAMNLNKNFRDFNHKEIGKVYYIEYITDTLVENDKEYVCNIKSIILRKF